MSCGKPSATNLQLEHSLYCQFLVKFLTFGLEENMPFVCISVIDSCPIDVPYMSYRCGETTRETTPSRWCHRKAGGSQTRRLPPCRCGSAHRGDHHLARSAVRLRAILGSLENGEKMVEEGSKHTDFALWNGEFHLEKLWLHRNRRVHLSVLSTMKNSCSLQARQKTHHEIQITNEDKMMVGLTIKLWKLGKRLGLDEAVMAWWNCWRSRQGMDSEHLWTGFWVCLKIG